MSVEKEMFERLVYLPRTGKVLWVNHPRWPSYSGREAGNVNQAGYRKLKFCTKQYLVHRVAWLLHYGVWPKGDIDHIDGNSLNNKIENLRDVPHNINIQNRKAATIKNKTGFLGVVKRRNKYAAHIHRNGKQIYLGLFDTPELAHKTYKENT
jgi:hypothetical protein